MEETFVELVCISVRGKLRVRIVSPHYVPTANVQFPRALRVEGRRYRVPRNAVQLIDARGTYFYTVRASAGIEVLSDAEEVRQLTHVYEDDATEDCVVCMEAPKDIVFAPCLHFYCCAGCAGRLQRCPICRESVLRRVPRSAVG